MRSALNKTKDHFHSLKLKQTDAQFVTTVQKNGQLHLDFEVNETWVLGIALNNKETIFNH